MKSDALTVDNEPLEVGWLDSTPVILSVPLIIILFFAWTLRSWVINEPEGRDYPGVFAGVAGWLTTITRVATIAAYSRSNWKIDVC